MIHSRARSLVNRDDVERAARTFIDPLMRRMDPSGARFDGLVEHPARSRVAHLEAFARSLWVGIAVSRGGGTFEYWDHVRSGLVAGTDPSHPHYWGTPGDYDQRFVEMGHMSVGILLVPDHLWHPLGAQEQQRILDWLAHVETSRVHDHNWQFFRVLNDLARRSVGARIDEIGHRRALDAILTRMLQDGWWDDRRFGDRQPVADWYSVFVWHVFALVYAVSGQGDPEISQRFIDHAVAFAQQHKQWFAPDGTALAYGRSMVYRLAQASFWAILPVAGVEALPWGEIKGLYLRAVRQWLNRPILDVRGVVSRGYWTETPSIVESYISAGSPYWASQAFIALAVPSHHPFWTSDETASCSVDTPSLHVEPGFVISTDGRQVLGLSSGRSASSRSPRHRGQYSKLAYSSHFPFTLEDDDVEAASESTPLDDATLAIRISGRWFGAGRVSHTALDGPVALRRTLFAPGVVVDTAIWGRAPWHRRVHIVHTWRPVTIVEYGFALPHMGEVPDVELSNEPTLLLVARTASAASGIVDLSGGRVANAGVIPSTQCLSGSNSTVPYLAATVRPGRHRLVTEVSAHVGLDSDSTPIPSRPTEAEWESWGGSIETVAQRLGALCGVATWEMMGNRDWTPRRLRRFGAGMIRRRAVRR